jgi:hypothetical protein
VSNKYKAYYICIRGDREGIGGFKGGKGRGRGREIPRWYSEGIDSKRVPYCGTRTETKNRYEDENAAKRNNDLGLS